MKGTINLTQKELKMLLVDYYRKQEHINNVYIKIGFYLQSTNSPAVSLSAVKTIEQNGKRQKVREELNEDRLQEILQSLLNTKKYEIKDINFLVGKTERVEGFGASEHIVLAPYFKGVSLAVEKKENNHSLSRTLSIQKNTSE